MTSNEQALDNEERSMQAFCEIIELANKLNLRHLRECCDYLRELCPLSEGDVLCDEDTGSVYIFKRFDTLNRIVAWDSRNGFEVIDPIPEQLWRYERADLVSEQPQPPEENK